MKNFLWHQTWVKHSNGRCPRCDYVTPGGEFVSMRCGFRTQHFLYRSPKCTSRMQNRGGQRIELGGWVRFGRKILAIRLICIGDRMHDSLKKFVCSIKPRKFAGENERLCKARAQVKLTWTVPSRQSSVENERFTTSK